MVKEKCLSGIGRMEDFTRDLELTIKSLLIANGSHMRLQRKISITYIIYSILRRYPEISFGTRLFSQIGYFQNRCIEMKIADYMFMGWYHKNVGLEKNSFCAISTA